MALRQALDEAEELREADQDKSGLKSHSLAPRIVLGRRFRNKGSFSAYESMHS